MNTFAFIVHPITVKQIKKVWPFTKHLPDFVIRMSLRSFPTYRASHIKAVRSRQGKQVEGYFITCPLLPQQMQSSWVLDKIISAGRFAQHLGANILGVGGSASVVGERGFRIAQKLQIPVTTGASYTAWSVVEAIYRLCRIKNKDLKNSSLTVVGATSAIGSLCSRKLSGLVGRITLTCGQREKLERLKDEITALNSSQVSIEEDMHQAVKEADLIIITAYTTGMALGIEEFRPESIVCDVSFPKSISTKSNPRQDITVVQCGIIKLPYPIEQTAAVGLPREYVYANMAETMLLALEDKLTSYSLGDDLNLDRVEEIADIAARHGFEVWVPEAPLV